MKKYQIILCSIILPFKALAALSLADLDVDPRVKQQIADGFALQQSIQQFLADNQDRTVVTVGGDNACDYRIGSNRIQNAINENTNVEIRIATNDTYNENLVIDDNSVSLKGGYANCTDAANDIFSQNYTTINGVIGAEQPVIRILGNTQRNTITLENLIITKGEGTSENFPGGGVSIYQADAQIAMIATEVLNNSSSRNGGGLAIIGGDTDIIATGLTLRSNTAQAGGGGFFCDSSTASLVMHPIVRAGFLSGNMIVENNAINTTGLGDGGGMRLNGCSFIMYSGGTYNISNNTAIRHGGGIQAHGGSIVTLFGHEVCNLSGACFGTDTAPVHLGYNTAEEGEGGGARIVGTDSMLNIYAGNVVYNKGLSSGRGGAIRVSFDATFTTKRLSKACWSQENCNYYGNNAAFGIGTRIGVGGAIHCSFGTVSVTNTVFAYNRADWGTVMSLGRCNNSSIRGSLMYQNGNYEAGGDWQDKNVIMNSSNTDLDIYHTTIVDNNTSSAILHNQDNGNVKIVASIIHDASTGPILSGNATTEVECSMLHEDASLTTLPTFSIVDDPEFIDRNNRDYRLNAQTSPAVDYCYATNTGIHTDIDFESEWDDPMVNNLYGPFDIGANETYDNDIVFTNDFE